MAEFSPVASQWVLDPEALVDAIHNANFQPCQLSAGPSPSWLARVICPGGCLNFASIGPAMLFSGPMPMDCYTLVFVTECQRMGRSFNFATEYNAGYMGFFPPGGMLDGYTPEGYTNATFAVSTFVFEAAVERLFPEIPESVLKRGAGMRIGAAEQNRLVKLLRAVEQGIKDPAGPLVSEAVRRNLETELLDAFLSALQGGCESLVPTPGIRVEGRLKRLKKARDYLTDHLHESISLVALCGEMEMSKRGVELLFRDSLGIGPNTFLRHQRLHGVRRALRTAPRAAGVVKQTAIAWGFWHMGHFARQYREFFGENPNMTLVGRPQPSNAVSSHL